MKVPRFDIFSGTDNNAQWIEVVEGLDTASRRMKFYAAKMSRQIVAPENSICLQNQHDTIRLCHIVTWIGSGLDGVFVDHNGQCLIPKPLLSMFFETFHRCLKALFGESVEPISGARDVI